MNLRPQSQHAWVIYRVTWSLDCAVSTFRLCIKQPFYIDKHFCLIWNNISSSIADKYFFPLWEPQISYHKYDLETLFLSLCVIHMTDPFPCIVWQYGCHSINHRCSYKHVTIIRRRMPARVISSVNLISKWEFCDLVQEQLSCSFQSSFVLKELTLIEKKIPSLYYRDFGLYQVIKTGITRVLQYQILSALCL